MVNSVEFEDLSSFILVPSLDFLSTSGFVFIFSVRGSFMCFVGILT